MSTPRFLELPPGVRRTDIATARGTIAALQAMPTSGGCELQAAVLVPGYTGSKEDFLAILQTLAQAGRPVIAIDLPGQYQSPGLERVGDYTRAALGQVIGELIAALGHGPVHLLGHSFGGLLARETVLANEAPLLSLTMMSSGPSGIEGVRAGDARRLVAALGPEPTRDRVREVWTEHLDEPARASGVPEEIHAFLRERMLANDPEGLVRMAEELLTAPDRTTELTAVADLPKLVLYGENDDAWPPEVQATMAKYLGAERVVIPGAAHSPNVEAPETTARALTEFWTQAETPDRTGDL
ncbi:alpha/beta fold hydrolase [Allosalinactinospora lopnorensis]|uniref:alpha/beta fold hydrolase n=1 Tax=Allosalinactinospora lopnorensis TaxID=1352348 RepID=UPI0009E4D491|nr:alpha/beta fold hydrolase [Allosalinactinospora lopnorensis]